MALDELEAVGSILQGDSKIVVSWAAGSLCPWCYLDKMDMIIHSMILYECSVSWVPRSVNSDTDESARQGVSLFADYKHFHVNLGGFPLFGFFGLLAPFFLLINEFTFKKKVEKLQATNM